jgi:hypothetical protein
VAAPHQKIGESPSTPDERDFVNWGRELFRLVATNERFTFVRHPGVEPTNNVSERELRGPALCRKTGRTNKTPLGAHHQSAITSVLRSLPKHLPTFTLSGVMSEVLSWPQPGSFARLVRRTSRPSMAATNRKSVVQCVNMRSRATPVDNRC